MRAKRIKYGKEPVHHGNRYLLAIGRPAKRCWHWGFRWVLNLKEVKAAKNRLKKGMILEVYSIDYNFREAWQK